MEGYSSGIEKHRKLFGLVLPLTILIKDFQMAMS